MSVLNNSNAISTGGADYNLESSLRFRRSANAYLSRTPTTAGNRKTFTFSLWFKGKGYYTGNDHLIGVNTSSTSYARIYYGAGGDNYLKVNQYVGGVNLDLVTTQVLRDPSAWYHLVVAFDTTQATASNRIKVYLNGEQITSFSTATYPSQNFDTLFNTTNEHRIGTLGATYNTGYEFDGYMTEVNFVDGQALTADDFGETDTTTGVWKPKRYAGTYGTNGFYLPMKETQQATGFNTVLYTGNGGTQSITGVGFSPDLVWIKRRDNSVSYHRLIDSVRGGDKRLASNDTGGETTASTLIQSFDADGYTVGTDTGMNASGDRYVAWCWDAGSSTVSNTDGDITASVRANPATGFSILTYTGNGASDQSIGHGLSTAPKVLICKERNNARLWDFTYTCGDGSYDFMQLNSTNAKLDITGRSAPTDSLIYVNGANSNTNTSTYVAYCFSEVSGYSKFGSYSGTGASGNTITTGFKPAFVVIKKTNADGNDRGWIMFDNTRDPSNEKLKVIEAQSSAAEFTDSAGLIFTDTGFTINNSFINQNASGDEYIYMAFADTRDAQFNFDASGNKNNWTANNINSNASSESTYDIMNDVPTLTDEDTANFATLNPLHQRGSNTFSSANLNFTISAGINAMTNTIAVNSGKHYCEISVAAVTGPHLVIGLVQDTISASSMIPSGTGGVGYYAYDGTKFIDGTQSSYGASYTNGDVIGIALDLDSSTIAFYKNNTSQGTFSIPSGKSWYVALQNGTGTGTQSGYINFGQRPFKYTPPTGYKKLNTYNLPDSTIVDGSQYMNPVLWTGTGTTTSFTGMGFSPDLVWLKRRDSTSSNFLVDSVRGASKALYANDTTAEVTRATAVTSFDSDGWSMGSDFNTSGASYVTWGWRSSDSSAVSNTDGTITSTVSANTDSGFSIVTYTGTAAVATVGHGLGVAPSMIITKNRDTTTDWWVYHAALGNTKYIVLNTTAAAVTSSTAWNNTSPTSTVFTLGGAGNPSNANQDVAYCFAEVEGFSKFGSYTGNGSADGPFVYTGFDVKFLLYKNADATNSWVIYDNVRDPNGNPQSYYLIPNSSGAEGTTPDAIDFLSNGFKIRYANASLNTSGQTHIYMAFASNPFKNSLAQ